MCHPGRCRDALRSARTRLKESREQELEALIATETRDALGAQRNRAGELCGAGVAMKLLPGKRPDVIEIQCICALSFDCKLQFDIGGEYENSAGTDCGDGGVGQSQPFEQRMDNEHPAWIIGFLDLLNERLEQPANLIVFLAREFGKIANLAEDMRRGDQLAEVTNKTHQQIKILESECLSAFEFPNTSLVDGADEKQYERVSIDENPLDRCFSSNAASHQASASSRIFMDSTSPSRLFTMKLLYSRLGLPSIVAMPAIGSSALTMLSVMRQASLVDSTSSSRKPAVLSGPRADRANFIALSTAS